MKHFLAAFLTFCTVTAGVTVLQVHSNTVYADQYNITETVRQGTDTRRNELFVYHEDNGNIIIDANTEKSSSLAELIIPSEIDGLPVTEIGKSAFWGSEMETLTIPESIRKIGIGAFAECFNLKKSFCLRIRLILKGHRF